jgi:hypothetical protein
VLRIINFAHGSVMMLEKVRPEQFRQWARITTRAREDGRTVL